MMWFLKEMEHPQQVFCKVVAESREEAASLLAAHPIALHPDDILDESQLLELMAGAASWVDTFIYPFDPERLDAQSSKF